VILQNIEFIRTDQATNCIWSGTGNLMPVMIYIRIKLSNLMQVMVYTGIE